MMSFTNSITKRLFLSFGALVINIIVITLLAFYFLWRTSSIHTLDERIDNQRILITHLIKTDLDFLRFETVNIQYFQTGKSQLLDERDSLFKIIHLENQMLNSDVLGVHSEMDQHLDFVDSAISSYNATFQLVKEKINERGFKDFGVEGVMRVCAHELENRASGIPLADVLTLRRHEKDFMMRREEKYIDNFNKLVQKISGQLQQNASHPTLSTLKEYQFYFIELVRLNFEIGVTPQAGLLGELNAHTKSIFGDLTKLAALSNVRKDQVIRQSAIYFFAISFLLIILSLVLTYYTSTRLARPIRKLSNSMGKFIVNEGLNEFEIESSLANDEISNLSQSFIKLSRTLKKQFNEILHQNAELKKLNAELDRFIYSAAHDLKSPLASLEGLISLAKLEINTTTHGHYFDMMTSSIRKLDGFIKDITDYAKNKRQQLKIEPIDIKAVIENSLHDLKFLPHASRLAVNISIDECILFSDRARLEIVFKNILSNSFRYMDHSKGFSFLTIEGSVTSEGLRVKFEDNGIGIGKQHLNRIFEMFYRAVENSQGTGIGLFLVKESVKILRGKIFVKSVLGAGSTFYLEIPHLESEQINIPEEQVVIGVEKMMA